jgi:hypothetical protein
MKCVPLLTILLLLAGAAGSLIHAQEVAVDPPVTLALPPLTDHAGVIDVPPPAGNPENELGDATVLTGDLFVPRCNYTASAHSSGPPHCGGDNCCADCGKSCPPSNSPLERCKACKQRLYWGYCNYFDERPFGATVVNAMVRQIHRGAADLLMLYEYDFYPRESDKAGQLTPRGMWQLQKIVGRMQVTPGQIVIQVTDDDLELTRWRREHVLEALAQQGMPASEQLVAFGRQRYGIGADDAVEMAQTLNTSTLRRGRTVSAGEQSGFGRATSTGFTN